eukprot:m.171866 g.171866  ORF g.171866 m.171866 type:complete len:80 (-) comp15358_c1_seq4:725-964(-)
MDIFKDIFDVAPYYFAGAKTKWHSLPYGFKDDEENDVFPLPCFFVYEKNELCPASIKFGEGEDAAVKFLTAGSGRQEDK